MTTGFSPTFEQQFHFGLLVLIAAAFLPFTAAAQGPLRESKQGMFTTNRLVQLPRPLYELQHEVPAPPGQLTCHADFDRARDGLITIYIINRSDELASISLQNGSPSFKAHRKVSDDQWERLQPANSWAMCGFDFSKLDIHPGMFVVVAAKYTPPGDRAATVRYEMIGNPQFTTNSGPGSWDDEEFAIAQIDGMTSRELPQWIEIFHSCSVDDRQRERRPRSRIELETAYLDLLLHYREFQTPRVWIGQLVAECEKHPAGWREVARRRLTRLRDRETVAAKTPAAFFDHCLILFDSSIPPAGTTHGDPERFGHPSQFPEMLWNAIADVTQRETINEAFPWSRVFEVMTARLPRASSDEIQSMAKVLQLERHVHEHLATEFLLDALSTPQRNFRKQCLQLLLQRNLEREIIKTADSFGKAEQFDVMELLIELHRPYLTARSGPVHDYLVARASEDPELAITAIQQGTRNQPAKQLSPELANLLHPQLLEIVSIGLDAPVEVATHEAREKILFVLRIGFDRRIKTLRKT